ncbi:MAG: hypothetical protein GQ559_11940 [Desulfobulbaceae bacterium]|nr:hypothetical protein [Desulfobulbaceae bacterium]
MLLYSTSLLITGGALFLFRRSCHA